MNEQKVHKKQLLIHKIEQEIDQIPSLPDNIEQVSELVKDRNADVKAIGDIIRRDPALMFDVLKVANSAHYKTRSRVATIERAITIIGTRELSMVLMRIAGLSIIDKFYGSMESISHHSNRCAKYAKEILKLHNSECSKEVAYTAGLLHDIGKLIFLNIIPGVMDRIDLLSETRGVDTWELERLAIGLTHAEIGAKITEKWGFPKPLIAAIDYHHNPLFAGVDEKDIVYSVYLGNILSYYPKVTADIMLRIEDKVLYYFGIKSEEELSEYLDIIRNRSS